MEGNEPLVRCVECRHEYELPRRGEAIACEQCGCPSWVSTQISDEQLRSPAQLSPAQFRSPAQLSPAQLSPAHEAA